MINYHDFCFCSFLSCASPLAANNTTPWWCAFLLSLSSPHIIFFRVYFLFLVVSWSMIESFHLLNLLLIFIGLSIHRFCCLPFFIVFWCSDVAKAFEYSRQGEKSNEIIEKFRWEMSFHGKNSHDIELVFYLLCRFGIWRFHAFQINHEWCIFGHFYNSSTSSPQHTTQKQLRNLSTQFHFSVFLCLFNNAEIYRYFASCLYAASIIIYCFYIFWLHFNAAV